MSTRIQESEGMDDLTGSFDDVSPATPAHEDDTPLDASAEEADDVLVDEADVETREEQARPEPQVIEIKAEKGKKSFKLDPEDKELRRTLSFGVAAGRWKKERDEAQKELKRLREERDAEMPTLSSLKQAKLFADKGYQEQAVRALLGEEGYKTFIQSQVSETIDYENADEATQRAIEKKRLERQAQFDMEQRENRIKELEDRLSQNEEAAIRTSLESLGTTYLQQYSFANYVKNEQLADKLNQKLWRLAMSDLEDVAEAEGDSAITPERMKKAFAENAKIMRAGMQRQAQERTRAIVETKKEAAKKTAQQIASSRYPEKYAEVANSKKWKSAKDLLNLMTRR